METRSETGHRVWSVSGKAFANKISLVLERHRPSIAFLIVNTDLERFQKFDILRSDIQSGFALLLLGKVQFFGCLFLMFIKANGGFQNEKNIITGAPDSGNGIADLIRIGKSIVNGGPELFHELL